MRIKSHIQRSFLSIVLIWTFLFVSLPVRGQVIVPGNIAGGSSKYVIVGLKKKGNFSTRRSSAAKRTAKQRSTTRRQVVKQSQEVAKENRVRRDIDEVTPEEYKRLDIKRMPKEEASKVLAGAGEYYVKRDEVDKAVTYLEGAVELDPENGDAKLALSEVYTTVGDQALVKADEYTDLAARATAANDTATAKLNSALANTETQKAESYYTEATKLDPKNPSAYVGLGQYYDAEGKDDLAKTNYEKALEIDPNLSEIKGPLGIIYFQEGEVAKADKLIGESLADDPDNAESQFFLGLIRYKENRNEESVAALRKSISLDDENAESHYYLGAALSRLGKDEEAIKEFERSVGLDQRFVNAWFDLGVAYYNKAEYEKAIAAFEKAIQFNTDRTDELRKINDESYANLAEAYRQSGKINLAIAKYRIAVARVTNDPELFTTYGFALAERDLWEPAIESFQSAESLKPDAPTYATNLGWAHYKAAMYYAALNLKDKQASHLSTARTILEKAVSEYSGAGNDDRENQAATNFYLGIVLNDLGEYKTAIDVLKKANSLSSEKWVAAVNELGISYRKSKDYKSAIKQFKRAVDIQEDYVFALFNLAEAEFQSGDEKEARKVQEKVKRLDPRLSAELDRVFRKSLFN
jgi:tetratricopeptide (TPR) repeat protein